MDNKKELKALDEALDYLNEGVLGVIAAIILAPYLATALIMMIASLIMHCRDKKADKTIANNPEVTKNIKNFALQSQKQILNSIPTSARQYLSKTNITISSKNLYNDKLVINLFDNKCFENHDYYEMTAAYIYDNMDDDEKEDKGLLDGDLSEIADNPNYFEDGWDNIYSGTADLEKAMKDHDEKAYNAYKVIEETVKKLSEEISKKTNSKSISYHCDTIPEAAYTDFNESYIRLIIKFVDYSSIKLPEKMKEEVNKELAKKYNK